MNEKNGQNEMSNFKNSGGGSSEDQRYLPRWNVRNRVRLAVESGTEIEEGETLDLSCSGVCIRLSRLLMPGKNLKMKIYLEEDNTVEVEGHVVWNRITEEGRYAGVNFDTAPLEVQEEILNYAFEINPDELVKHWFSGWDNPEKEASD